MTQALTFISFFDVAFVRLIFTLIVDYLISSGYLLPEQRQLWVDGWGHIIGIVGGVVAVTVWQYHSHKKDLLKQPMTINKTITETTQLENTPPSVLQFLPGTVNTSDNKITP